MSSQSAATRVATIVVGAMMLSQSVATAQNLSGAIFTSTESGDVNENQYASKCDVFLNGGPANPQCTSAGLPDGCYIFQVTAPPGGGQNETLLSQDSITDRFVRVSGGVFAPDDGTCAEAAAALVDCGEAPEEEGGCSGECGDSHDTVAGTCGELSTARTRLMPYADTPNNGGVYKVYVTRVEDYSGPNEQGMCEGVFGFVHSKSKTDNFKVDACDDPEEPPPPQGQLSICKFCDANADGERTFTGNSMDDEGVLGGWSVFANVVDGQSTTCEGTTDAETGCFVCGTNLDAGDYQVAEIGQDGFEHTATCENGVCQEEPENPTTVTVTAGGIHSVEFGNVPLSSVSGVKCDDGANRDGSCTGDAGVAGIVVRLFETTEDGDVEVGCAVTDQDGTYSFDGLLPGTYKVVEEKPTSTVATTPTECADLALIPDASTCEGVAETCDFGNVCLGVGGGRTLGFWSNKNGEGTMKDAGSLNPELAILSGLNLRNAAGAHFDPMNYAAFRSWLLGGTATNMAYMLSVQMAAMQLNVEASFVAPGATVYGGSCIDADGFITISELLSAANTSLGSFGSTLSGHPQRANQQCLKNALDDANNNKNFVVPCGSFSGTCGDS